MLKDRVVAVTGASRGIGLAIAELLAANGARVIAGSRRPPDPPIDGVQFAALDVTDESSVAEFARIAVAADVDTLVNNAGIGVFKAMEAVTVEEYRRVMDTNVLGLILTSRHFVPHFRKRHEAGKHSQMVNVTSDVSNRTFAGGGLYSASKYAQRALTQALAFEGQDYGMRVTEIRPGLTDTFFNGNIPGRVERRSDLRPLDVARSVLHVLGAEPHLRIDELLVHPLSQPVVF